MTPDPAIAISALTKSYGTRRALDQLSLSIERGSRTVVLGHNGAGKSTLLEIIATLRTPTSGTVTVEGHDTVAQAREARRLIGLTPQSNALDPLATPTEVLAFQAVALGLGRRDATRRTRELLDMFGLGEHRRTRIATLSGGTRRKVDLAVALVSEPPVVILDEPTTGFDPAQPPGLLARAEAAEPGRQDSPGLDAGSPRGGRPRHQRRGAPRRHGRRTGSPASLKQRVGQRTLTLALADAATSQALLTSSVPRSGPNPTSHGPYASLSPTPPTR
ncbi:ABC transporter ATP-binding protein [Salinispora arenicola]|uniref:ABC transporter ATP-binding protein n=1 Tax=Salinispora arenicola TaxID=168697 RepID=UPI0027DCD121|nr:ATP-binding cassette domain-containing protein [Salinispora arenicola]